MVEPIDDFRDEHPCVNEPLLDYLSAELIRNDFDLKPASELVNTMKEARNQVLERLEADDGDYNPKAQDIPFVASIEFPTMLHGWVSRGNPADPNVAAAQERALQLTVDFIQKHSK